jgi:RNA polymerase sigma factor (sigma-70 family)
VDGAVRVRRGGDQPVARSQAEHVCGERPDADAYRFIQRLYREHSAGLVRRLARYTGCSETALDLTHETFAKLLRIGPARLGAIEQPEAYLHRMSLNLARDRGRTSAACERALEQLGSAGDDRLDQVAVLESRDTLRRLERAIDRLKPKTRDIFLAHRLEGLTYAQIANRTGLSVKGVEKQMSKAIAKIDRLLDRA